MKIRDTLLVICILLTVSFVFGCNSNQEYHISDSTFKIGSDWWTIENTSSANDSVKFNNTEMLTLRLTQYNNPYKFESDYEDALSGYTDIYNVTTENMSISGISVIFINATDTASGEALQDYYFQKNGKYYSIHVADYSEKKFFGLTIKSAVESIISTIK